MKSFIHSAGSLLKRFRASDHGNIAMSFALAIVPLGGAVGVAVDYSRLYRANAELQQAVDSAVLAAARQFADETSIKSLESYARNYLDSNFELEVADSTVTFVLTSASAQNVNSENEYVGLELTGKATVKYPMTFSKVLGGSDRTVTASASVLVNNYTVEAAFVFDASGSMTDNDGFGKSTKAAKDLLHDMKQFVLSMQNATGTNTEYFRYALIPFAHSVNIGPAYRTNDAVMDTLGLSYHHHDNIDWAQGVSGATATGDGWKKGSDWLTKFTLLDNIGDSWMGCVEARPEPYFLDDTAPNALNADTLYVPLVAPDEPDNYGGTEVDYQNNYLTDDVDGKNSTLTLGGNDHGNEKKQASRIGWTSKYNTHATVNQYAKNGMGPNVPCFDYPIYPLNGDFGQTNAQISHLNNTYAASKTIGSGDDDGASNIQQGLVWGWRTVSSSVPFDQGRAESDPLNKKALILITDGINSYGDNTTLKESAFGAFGYASDKRLDYKIVSPEIKTTRQKMDEQTLKTCENIKNAGIRIFVIGYGVTSGSGEQAFLSQCSGGPEKPTYYYSVSDEVSLTEAFSAIKEELVKISLAS